MFQSLCTLLWRFSACNVPSPFCLYSVLALTLCYYVTSFSTVLISCFLLQSWDTASNICHYHNKGKQRLKENFEDESSLDSIGTATLENLTCARCCGKKDESLIWLSYYTINIINISELDLHVKKKKTKKNYEIIAVHSLYFVLRAISKLLCSIFYLKSCPQVCPK